MQYAYYTGAATESDAEYDATMRALSALEAAHPDLPAHRGPSHTVGGFVTGQDRPFTIEDFPESSDPEGKGATDAF